jgi:plastocyanin
VWVICFDEDESMKRAIRILSCVALLVAANFAQLWAQEDSVAVDIVVAQPRTTNAKKSALGPPDASNVAVWLTPLAGTKANPLNATSEEKPPRLVQRNKTFEPHVLIVPVGTLVEFPNKDPFFHNIFSLYDGRRFDLGLYEAGTSRTVRFDRPGVSFLFCNIHGEMSAVVIALDTPYFGLSNRSGHVIVHNVPDGLYELNVWYERGVPEDLKKLARVVTVSNSARNLGTIRIIENPNFTPAHKNKYGLDYVPPPNADYDHP